VSFSKKHQNSFDAAARVDEFEGRNKENMKMPSACSSGAKFLLAPFIKLDFAWHPLN
jgi:hypothetical protein